MAVLWIMNWGEGEWMDGWMDGWIDDVDVDVGVDVEYSWVGR